MKNVKIHSLRRNLFSLCQFHMFAQNKLAQEVTLLVYIKKNDRFNLARDFGYPD
jgi:hypothetical protein